MVSKEECDTMPETEPCVCFDSCIANEGPTYYPNFDYWYK